MSDSETIENVASGVSITGKAKMGSGTRDQAEVKIKGKGTDYEEAIDEFKGALEAAEEGNWGHRLLELNPERGDDG
jgi:hypothetical protein